MGRGRGAENVLAGSHPDPNLSVPPFFSGDLSDVFRGGLCATQPARSYLKLPEGG